MLIPDITIADNPYYISFLEKYLKKKKIKFSIGNKKYIGFIMNKKVISIPFCSAIGVNISSTGLHNNNFSNSNNISFFDSPNLPINKHYKIELRSFYKLSSYYYNKKVLSLIYLKKSYNHQFKTFSPNLRRKIRKAKSNGVKYFKISNQSSISHREKLSYLNLFYKLYKKQMKSFGSPQLGFNFFLKLFETYENGIVSIFFLYKENTIIGTSLSLSYNYYYENQIFIILKKYRSFYASYLLHEAMIKEAIYLKSKYYSFGRSTSNSGVHIYKKQWNSKDLQLYWNYSVPQEKNIREYHYLAKIWKLIPFFITNILGPVIAKRIN